MSRIGIFPGSFDPIHEGHLAFALKALESGIDTVYFAPEQEPRKKPNVSDINKRKREIDQEIAGKENLRIITLDQKIFSVEETLPELNKLFPKDELFLLVGDDVLSNMNQWEKLEKLSKGVELVVATRSYSEKEIDKFFQESPRLANFKYRIIQLSKNISSSQIRKEAIDYQV